MKKFFPPSFTHPHFFLRVSNLENQGSVPTLIVIRNKLYFFLTFSLNLIHKSLEKGGEEQPKDI